jgi:hypothetical protein
MALNGTNLMMSMRKEKIISLRVESLLTGITGSFDLTDVTALK